MQIFLVIVNDSCIAMLLLLFLNFFIGAAYSCDQFFQQTVIIEIKKLRKSNDASGALDAPTLDCLIALLPTS